MGGYGLTETCPVATTSARPKGTVAYADDRTAYATRPWPAGRFRA